MEDALGVSLIKAGDRLLEVSLHPAGRKMLWGCMLYTLDLGGFHNAHQSLSTSSYACTFCACPLLRHCACCFMLRSLRVPPRVVKAPTQCDACRYPALVARSSPQPSADQLIAILLSAYVLRLEREKNIKEAQV